MDWVSGFIVFLIGVFILGQGRHLSIGTIRVPGPGFFPFLLGVGLLILSLFLMIPKSQKKDSGGSFSLQSGTRVIIVFASLLAYFFLLEYLGFLTTGLLLMIFLFMGVERQKWHISLLQAFLSIALAYLLFEVLLKTNLPKGILGF